MCHVKYGCCSSASSPRDSCGEAKASGRGDEEGAPAFVLADVDPLVGAAGVKVVQGAGKDGVAKGDCRGSADEWGEAEEPGRLRRMHLALAAQLLERLVSLPSHQSYLGPRPSLKHLSSSLHARYLPKTSGPMSQLLSLIGWFIFPGPLQRFSPSGFPLGLFAAKSPASRPQADR